MIGSDFFTYNRSALSAVGLVVMAGNTAVQMVNDMSYRFTQESSFWYLTGINESDWKLIIDGEKSWLISPGSTETKRVFDGVLSRSEAKQLSGVDEVLTVQEGEVLLARLATQHSTAYTLTTHPHRRYFNFTENPAQARLSRRLKKLFAEVKDCRPELSRLRAIKQPEEVMLIRQSVKETCQAFDAVKSRLSTLRYEYEVEAEFTYEFRRHDFHHGYEPIVAAGGNACTLHYTANSDPMQNGQMILLDIGASKGGYCADITRTYAYGDVSDRQRAVHHAVEAAHHEVINLLKPGYSILQYQDDVDKLMKRALETVSLDYSDKMYRTYFPHAISHGLGIDVHDSLGGHAEFQPGMILTVEPGIYITDEAIGVRIEDDILITETGYENLSGALSTSL